MLVEYGEIALKLAIGLLAFILVLRTTGRGQLSQMNALDLIGNFVLGGIIGGVIYNGDVSVSKFVIVLLIWELFIICLNALRKYSTFFHDIIVGKVTPIIVNDEFQLKAYKHVGIDIADFITLLRLRGVTLHDINYAQIETNNQISVILKDENKKVAIVITKGVIDQDALKRFGKDEAQLMSQLRKQGYTGEVEAIFCAEWLEIKDEKGKVVESDLYIITGDDV